MLIFCRQRAYFGMVVTAVENHCLGCAVLEEENRFVMGALPYKKYVLVAWQVGLLDIWEKA